MLDMPCPNCDQPVEVPPEDEVHFVMREDNST